MQGFFESVVNLFTKKAMAQPNAIALSFRDDRLTFKELDLLSAQFASQLNQRGISVEDRVGLVTTQNIKTVVAILGILRSGAAYVPIDPLSPLERRAFILNDADLSCLVVEEHDKSWVNKLDLKYPILIYQDLMVLPAPSLTFDSPIPVDPKNAAYVIYTSGSTGNPKGVVVEHHQLVRLFTVTKSIFPFNENDKWSLFHSLAFDFSVWEMWGALLNGGCLVMVPPEVTRAPDLLHKFLLREAITVFNVTPSVFYALMEEDKAANEHGDPSLQNLHTVIFGGEQLSFNRLRWWIEDFAPSDIRLVNMYGITETTVHVTWFDFEKQMATIDGTSSIGLPLPDITVYVLDENLRKCAVNEVGELYVGGGGVSRGYLRRTALTAERFIANPFGIRGDRLYRSGDLASIDHGGKLYFHGRADDQIKLRGFRIEPGEIEAALTRHPGISEACVILHQRNNDIHKLIAFVVTTAKEQLTNTDYRRWCEDLLPDYMVPSVFVVLESLPLTVNGKIDRRALQARFETEGALPKVRYVAPETREAVVLCQLVAELLGVERVGLEDHFFQLGGHSLIATRLIAKLQLELGRAISIRDVFEQPILGVLAETLRNASCSDTPLLTAGMRPDPLPASFAQARLWLVEQIDGPMCRYVIPLTLRLDGRLDNAALWAALDDVVARHESLRTLLKTGADGTPLQEIVAATEAHVERVVEVVTRDELDERLSVYASRPFHLDREFPLRAVLLSLEDADEEQVLLLSLHHSAADGWSLTPLMEDLANAYAARKVGHPPNLVPLPIQYGDYAQWQAALLGERDVSHSLMANQLVWWQQQLIDLPEEIALPTDHQRAEHSVAEGGRVRFELSQILHARLLEFARQEGASLFMVLLTGLVSLLQRMGAGDDIPIGVPVAGRSSPLLDRLVGFFVNTVVMRVSAEADPSFKEMLARVRQVALDSYAHQDLPFDHLVEVLSPPRVPGRQPLFQTMLVLHNEAIKYPAFDGLRVVSLESPILPARFDLSFAFTAEAGANGPLSGVLDYNANQFESGTAEALCQRFVMLLEAAVNAPSTSLSALPVLLSPEVERVTFEIGESCEFRLTDLLELSAKSTNPAVSMDAEVLAHAELHDAANRLAWYLIRQGVGPEDVVSIALPRSPALVISVLGVLKAGAAFLPLESNHPSVRLQSILAEAHPVMLITNGEMAPHFAELTESPLFLLESLGNTNVAPPEPTDADRKLPLHPGHPAYLLYTSGSTGRPKGVLISHSSIAHYLTVLCEDVLVPGETERVALFTPLVFDLSLTSLLLPLVMGTCLELCPEGVPQEALAKIFGSDSLVRMVKLTPTHLALLDTLPEDTNPRLGLVIVGGETLRKAHVEVLKRRAPHARIFNEYGPTETTIGGVAALASETDQAIGLPYRGVSALVLDDRLQLCPTGVIGELYLAGSGLARGYYNRPGLTADRFIANPYGAPGVRLYRTGDRVRWRADGRLVYEGRSDDQVKIRGHRIEPGEVEAALMAHEAIAQAVVMACSDSSGESQLHAWLLAREGQPQLTLAALQVYLADRLTSTMIPSSFTWLASFPVTANGKLDRKRLSEPVNLPRRGLVRNPETNEEELVCRLTAELLGLEFVSVEDDFFLLGGHSLAAARLIAAVRKATGKTLTMKTLFAAPGLRQIAAALASQVSEVEERQLTADPERFYQPFPLMPVQQAYWLGRQRLVTLSEFACHAYTEYAISNLDPERFTQAWHEAIMAHPALRTVITPDGMQCIQSDVPALFIPIEDCRDLPGEEAEARARATGAALSHQVLDTASWPLFDVRLTRLSETDWRIHLSIDALILDGESTALLLMEIFNRYEGCPPEPMRSQITFRDYVLYQEAGRIEREAAEAWWIARLDTLPSAPGLPLRMDPARFTAPRFVRWHKQLEPGHWSALKTRAGAEGLTPSSVLLAAYSEVLAGWTRQETFTLNLTVGDRQILHPDISCMLGVFTTLTPLAVYTARSGSFIERARTQQSELVNNLDHRAFSGVEVQRAIARRAGNPEAGLLPVVFTSLLGEARFTLSRYGVQLVDAITQTPQTWLDNKVYEDENEALFIDWDVPEGLFPSGVIEAMIDAYHRLLMHLAVAPSAWTELDRSLIPADQLALMATLNDTTGPYPEDRLADPVFAAMARNPLAPALIQQDQVISYGRLKRLVDYHAQQLDALLSVDDELIAIVMEKGIEQVIAALAILKLGRAFLPISAGQPDARIATILKQADVRLALTQSQLTQGKRWQSEVVLLNVRCEDSLVEDNDMSLTAMRQAKSDDLAYVIYTSGSTGIPKGVAISHRSARNTLADMVDRFAITDQDRVLWVSSFEFDLSIFDLFALLGEGGSVVIPPPDARETPEILSKAVAEYGVTVWNSVPAIAELMLAAAQAPKQMLVSLRLILLSGDWIPLSLPSALRNAVPNVQLISLGGATEASIWSIHYPIETIQSDWISIPYGMPLRNQAFHVLKEDKTTCPLHVPGRLYIEGVGLAMGYWRDPEQTAARFIHHPLTGVRLYDTGDLGYRDERGVIRFLGREDTQIKIRGFRIELGEIDKVLETHPAIKAATAIVIQSEKQHKIVAAVVLDNECSDARELIRDWCREYLPSYMEPTAYVFLENLPLTRNGKIDREALKICVSNSVTLSAESTRPANTPHEIVVCAIVENLLGIDKVVPMDNFFHLGGDSIAVVKLVNNLTQIGWSLTPSDVFATPDLEALSNLQADRGEKEHGSDTRRFSDKQVPAESPLFDEIWPLTPLQEGLWFLAHCEPEGYDPYNVQIIVDFDGYLDINRFQNALQGVMNRHESLRVYFDSNEFGNGMQIVTTQANVPFEIVDLSDVDHVQQNEISNRIEIDDRKLRFDLAKAPLIRATCLRLGSKKHRLILSQHHLLGDGWSSAIFFRELYELYRTKGDGTSLGRAASLADFLTWRSMQDQSENLDFWCSRFDDFVNLSLLDPDAARDRIPSMAHSEILLSADLSSQIVRFARAEGVTEASVFEGVWALFVSILSGVEDICFGSVGSGREAPVTGIENIIGLLITTIPVRIRVDCNLPIGAIIRALHQDRGQRLEHQYVSLSEIQKVTGHTVLFDTLFTYENYPLQDAPDDRDPEALPVSNIRGTNGNHYPASLAVIPGERILIRFHYSETRFLKHEADAWLMRLEMLLSQIVRNSQCLVRDLDYLLPEDIQYNTKSNVVVNNFQSLPQLIRDTAAHNPQAPAVSDATNTLSYAVLLERSEAVAHYLRVKGVGAEDRVALLLPRNSDAIAAMLGVWSVNAAFVPIDPNNAIERLYRLLTESGCKLILTTESLGLQLTATDIPVVILDRVNNGSANGCSFCTLSQMPTLLAYVIYTSGSTGCPKGVEVSHAGLPLLAREQAIRMGIDSNSRVLQLASFSFDAAISEIAMTLIAGAHLIISAEHERAGTALTDLLTHNAITHATMTPTVLSATRPPSVNALQRVISAGEMVTMAALGPWGKSCEIINAYGPTEATVCATMSAPWLASDNLPSIGKAIGVTDVLVLDHQLRQCPIGVVGYIYLSGLGLARGYTRQPGLTAVRFVANPYDSGARMYMTGDLGCRMQDGSLCYKGRIDNQIKIRGHRVEPSEVVAVLTEVDAVREAVVTSGLTPKQAPTLIAYLTANMDDATLVRMETEQIHLWNQIEDGFGSNYVDAPDPTFDTRGWNSSYTGEPLPASEVADYINETVARINRLSPCRILDVGCGAGLIGFRLMSMNVAYTGTDLAAVNIERLRRLQARTDLLERFPGLSNARFYNGPADQLTFLNNEQRFDTIILTSVVQYFPSARYLSSVLISLARKQLDSEGSIFIGDVMSLPLLKAYEYSLAEFVGFDQACEMGCAKENELALDPAYFYRLMANNEYFNAVSVLPKRASNSNEMTRYRYDVVLYSCAHTTVNDGVFDNSPSVDSMSGLKQLLKANSEAIVWRGIDNSRILESGIDPNELWELGEDFGYRVDIALLPFSEEGGYDVIFRRDSPDLPIIRWASFERVCRMKGQSDANYPLLRRLQNFIGDQARQMCSRLLPSYMIPSTFMVVDHLPMTSHGKIDYKRLPLPVQTKSRHKSQPINETEHRLCQLVEQVLGQEGVGIEDNFFHLGGDSISSIRLINLARDIGIELTAKDVFLAPVLRDLANLTSNRVGRVIETGDPVGSFPTTPIMRWFVELGGLNPQFSQSVLIALPSKISSKTIVDALQILFDHHAMLRSTWKHPESMVTLAPGSVLAKQKFRKVIAHDVVIKDIVRELTNDLDLENGNVLNACWLEEESAPGKLLLVAHHVAVDGVSWQILLSDLMLILEAKSAGNSPPPLRQTTSFRYWAQKLADMTEFYHSQISLWRWHGSNAVVPYFEVSLNTERDRVGTAQDFYSRVNGKVVDTLFSQTSRELGAHIDELLITALIVAMQSQRTKRTFGQEGAIRIDVERHGRPIHLQNIDFARTVGWFTAIHPLTLELVGVESLKNRSENTRALKQCLRRVMWEMRRIPDMGIGYGVLRYLDNVYQEELLRQPATEVCFNYFGRTTDSKFITDETGFVISGVADDRLPLAYPLSINATSRGKGAEALLDIHWRFAPAIVNIDVVRGVASAFELVICRLVEIGQAVKKPLFIPDHKTNINVTAFELENLEAHCGELEAIWPLSAVQQGIMTYVGNNDPYRVQMIIELSSQYSPLHVKDAFGWLVQRHSGLRVIFARDSEGQAFQAVKRQFQHGWQEWDLSNLSTVEQQVELRRLISEDRVTMFDLEKSPLIRGTYIKSSDRVCLVISLHHLIADGWSGELLMHELAIAINDPAHKDLPPAVSIKHYIDWVSGQSIEKGLIHWKQHLSGYNPPPPIRAQGETHLYSRSLPENTYKRLSAVARSHSVTLATLLAGVWSMLLGFHRNQDRICIGLVSSGRNIPVEGVEKMVGMLVQTVPLCLHLAPTAVVLDLIEGLHQFLGKAQPYMHTPLSEIQRAHGQGQLFDTLFTYENFPSRDHAQNLLRITGGFSGTHYPLSLIAVPNRSLDIQVQFTAENFSEQEIANIVDRLFRILSQIIDKPTIRLCDIDFANNEERKYLIRDVNQTVQVYDDLTLPTLFESQVRRHPDAIAIAQENDKLTYTELDKMASQIAVLLQKQGLVPADVVLLCLPSSIKMIAAILGVLKNGATYLPFDPRMPDARLKVILEDAKPKITITVSMCADRFNGTLLNLDDDLLSRIDPDAFDVPHFTPDYGTHIIYTSGSTGKPKGVIATHRNVVRLVKTNLGEAVLSNTGVWTMLHSYAFDFSIYEMWGAFASGSRLVVVSEEVARSPVLLLNLLIKQRVTVLNITPGSYANLMLEAQQTGRLSKLKIQLALVGGEAWSPDRIAAHPSGACIRNVYGPTECTIFTTMSEPLDLSESDPPLGRFLPNVQGYVLDASLKPCPIGVEGELYVCGDGITRGYLNRPGLTASMFVANPFGELGQRMYRTGDRAMWLQANRLVFRGRDDGQCKLRGFRIELGEIETTLLTLPLVRQVSVHVQGTTETSKQLIAYVVPAENFVGDDELAHNIKNALRDMLPSYMIPSVFIWLEQMPMNANGKLDKNALFRVHQSSRPQLSYQPPMSPLEIAICQQAATALKVARVGLNETLVDYGLDSLSAARLAANIGSLTMCEVGVMDILGATTVSDIIDRIAGTANNVETLSEVITLRNSGSGVPVFCLYPGTGLSWSYANLLPLLSRGRPVYLIQASNLESGPLPDHISFASQLERIKHIIAQCHPSGPYSLVGWSFGGMLAHCLATQLEAAGEKIQSLILIDSYPMPSCARPDYTKEDTVWRDIALGTGLKIPDHTEALTVHSISELAVQQNNVLGRFSLQTLAALAFNLKQNSYVLPDAQPQRFEGDVLFFKATRKTENKDRSMVTPEVWRNFLSGQLHIFDIDAEHQTMLAPEAVAQMRGRFS